MKKTLLIGLGWLVSIVFLYIAIQDLSWSTVSEAFSKVSLWIPVIMVGIYGVSFVLRAWRWRILLSNRVSGYNSLASIVLGYAANNVLPARLGELVRANAIAQTSPISGSLALASILVERIFDGLILTMLMYLGIRTQNAEIPPWAASVGFVGLGIFGGALVILLVLVVTRSRWASLIDRLPSAKLRELLSHFAQGLVLIGRTPLTPIAVISMTLSIWLVEGMMFVVAIAAFDLPVPRIAALFVLGIVNLGILVPSAPGYLGTFQYFGTLALGAWQIPAGDALACIVLIHACQYLPITIWGLSYIPRFGFTSLRKLSNEVK